MTGTPLQKLIHTWLKTWQKLFSQDDRRREVLSDLYHRNEPTPFLWISEDIEQSINICGRWEVGDLDCRSGVAQLSALSRLLELTAPLLGCSNTDSPRGRLSWYKELFYDRSPDSGNSRVSWDDQTRLSKGSFEISWVSQTDNRAEMVGVSPNIWCYISNSWPIIPPGIQIGFRSSSEDLSWRLEYFLVLFLLLVRNIDTRMKINMMKMMARMMPEMTPMLSWMWVLLPMMTWGDILSLSWTVPEKRGSWVVESSAIWFICNKDSRAGPHLLPTAVLIVLVPPQLVLFAQVLDRDGLTLQTRRVELWVRFAL